MSYLVSWSETCFTKKKLHSDSGPQSWIYKTGESFNLAIVRGNIKAFLSLFSVKGSWSLYIVMNVYSDE